MTSALCIKKTPWHPCEPCFLVPASHPSSRVLRVEVQELRQATRFRVWTVFHCHPELQSVSPLISGNGNQLCHCLGLKVVQKNSAHRVLSFPSCSWSFIKGSHYNSWSFLGLSYPPGGLRGGLVSLLGVGDGQSLGWEPPPLSLPVCVGLSLTVSLGCQFFSHCLGDGWVSLKLPKPGDSVNCPLWQALFKVCNSKCRQGSCSN